MPTGTVTPASISLGPGKLSWAPLGTAYPTDHSTALIAAYAEIGSTEAGSTISYEITADPVSVAESLDPLFYRTTGRKGSVSFAMSENTTRNLTLAFNGGTVASYGTGGTAGFRYEPPAPGTEKSIILVWESEDGQERWLFKRVHQGGAVAMSRKNGADKATLPVEFQMEAPATGQPWSAFYANARSGGAVAIP